MFPDPDGHAMKSIDPLGAALRALPPAAPPGDLYAQVARTLEARRAGRRWQVPAALAASILFGWLLVNQPWNGRDRSGGPADTPLATATTPAPSANDELANLQDYSRRLESWLADLSDGVPRDGRNLMAAAELEDLVGLVDVQLSAARSASESLPLWRQRVALLEDLATVRSEPFALAAEPARNGAASPTL
ncbi:hypothetical protein SAMN05216289_12136 [Dokdonella immobilis]|uniref:Uncharacterized protein n=2 Tax=Dokdonella immobilis TaxID=578942 RepID=A0A1I4YZ84_9GAMM|nr:hypothetical protein SAMN05216289_12136 [Dokdonella immobilis]